MATADTTKKKRKKRKVVTKGRIYVHSSYNNTVISFTDEQGNALAQGSAGRYGFKGPKKSTPYAAGVVVRETAERVKDTGLKDVSIFIKGIGSGRDGALRAIATTGFNIIDIKDLTPIPHNGCRPKKPRRV
ncbi:MAG: 30S ribosomal protein S11 [Candidatus Kerfeldbacteria bacterium]|nr:30S ribosomal protein S11 [Candidatus Kerfeldbacteria bacterium]